MYRKFWYGNKIKFWIQYLYKTTCKWSCNDACLSCSQFRMLIFSFPNFISRRWIFLPLTAFSYYNTLNLLVTERKLHLFKMKIDVNSQFFFNSKTDQIASLELHVQTILITVKPFVQSTLTTEIRSILVGDWTKGI